jgi:hypothetical protein
MKKLWEHIRFIFIRSWNLITANAEEWEKIEEESQDTNKRFLIPFVCICCGLLLLSGLLRGKPIHIAFLHPILWAIIFLLTIPFTLWTSRFLLRKIYDIGISDHLNKKIIGYSFTPVLLVKLIFALFPNFILAPVFVLLVPYILKFAMDTLLSIDDLLLKNEQKYYSYLLTISLSIIFTPFVIEFALKKIVFQNVEF